MEVGMFKTRKARVQVTRKAFLELCNRVYDLELRFKALTSNDEEVKAEIEQENNEAIGSSFDMVLDEDAGEVNAET